MNLIRYILDFFHINGAGQQAIKYAKDQVYPATEETLSHVVAGIAEVVSDAALAVKDFVEGKQETTEIPDPVATPEPSTPVATPQPVIEPVAAQPTTSTPVVEPTPAPLPEPVAVVSTTVATNTSAAAPTPEPVASAAAAQATQVPVSATAGNDPSVVVPPPVTTVVAPELGTPMASAEPAAQPAPAANS